MTVREQFGLHVKTATARQIEAAAKVAYENNRAGQTRWKDLTDRHKDDWRAKVKPVIDAALNEC